MEVSELIAEYEVARRNVSQEMLYRQLKACCGDCSGYFHGWAMMLGQRNNRGRSAHDYFHMEVAIFKKHVRACELAMEELDKVDSCISALDSLWDKDWRNPADNRFTQRTTEEKKEQYRRIYGGAPRHGCLDPDYRIQD